MNTFTFGQANAGNVNINARDTVSFDGASNGFASGIVSVALSPSTGNAGNININTGTLSLTNGAGVFTFSNGQGLAGSVTINASDRVFLDGAGSGVDTFNNSINSIVNNGSIIIVNNGGISRVNNGNISITTGSLTVRNGAELNTSTSGMGNAGNVKINARDRVSFNNGRIIASTNEGATGNGGDISITSGDISFANGSLIILFTAGSGNAGNALLTSRSLSLTDRSELTLNSFGQGNAGNVFLSTRSLSLTNGSRLTASSSPNLPGNGGAIRNGGNINLQIGGLLLLSRQTLISTFAGSSAFTANSGNISINAPFIVALPPNNDITANVFSGIGGNITINTQRLFGIAPLSRAELERDLNTTDPSQLNPNRLPTSDITAISQNRPTINSSDVDPSRGLVVLPKVMVQAPKLVSSSCNGFNETAGGSQFTITGRGGLPPSPDEPLTSDVVWTDTRLPVTTTQHQHKTHAAKPKPQPIVIIPATGWVVNDKGEVTLISSVSNPTIVNTPTSCPAR